MNQRKVERDSTILTPMTPTCRSYKYEMNQIMGTGEVFTSEECEDIITTFGDDMDVATTLEGGVHDYRISDVKMLAPSPESFPMMDKLLELVLAANVRFEFEIDHFEGIQITRYPVGGHYDWHKDIGVERAAHRKLSLSVQLSSPDDYEGGDLEFMVGEDNFTATKQRGSVTVFPSWERHRVTPVTKGERWALVVWASGSSRFR